MTARCPEQDPTHRDEAQVRALRGAVAMCDLGHLQLLRVSGADAVDFVQRMSSGDIKGAGPDRAVSAAFLTPKAHVLATVTLLQRDDDVLCVLPGETVQGILDHLDRHIIADRVTLEILERSLLGVYGPHIDQVPELTGLPVLDRDQIVACEIGGASCTAVGDDHLATRGVMLITGAGESERLMCRLDAHALRLGPTAHEIARIEAGTPRMGAEMGPERLILEAGQLHRVSLTKGCYPGQEPVCRILNRGGASRRVLAGLRFEGQGLPCPEDQLIDAQGGQVGQISSAAHSPTLRQWVGLGYVRREAYQVGTRLEVGSGGWATLVSLPHVRQDSPGP